MKKITHIIISTLVGFVLLLFLPFLVAHAEVIRSYDVDIYVNQDSTFDVVEKIEYDFSWEDKRGIFRFIPLTHPQKAPSFFRERHIEITNVQVLMDGEFVPFEQGNKRNELFIRIGDADRTITDVHEYEISYTVHGGLSYFDDGTAEIYWNATGNEWVVTIMGPVNVRVGAGSGLLNLDNTACYVGNLGEANHCRGEEKSGNDVVFLGSLFDPGEGMTVASAINPSSVEMVVLERVNGDFLGIGVFIIWILVFGIGIYRYRTKHKIDRVVIAQYEPYADFKPMYAGLLFDGTLHPQDITAGIVYLAQQGFIKIKKIKVEKFFLFDSNDYEVELLKDKTQVESVFLRDVLDLLFTGNLFLPNKVRLGVLKNDLSKRRKNSKIISILRSSLRNDLKMKGFFQHAKKGFSLFSTFVILLFVNKFLEVYVEKIPYGQVMLFIIIATVFVLMVSTGRRRTKKGYEALNHLQGFKLFLSVTDKERFEFHNAPEKNPEQFMEYLPYAIALGVEDKWAKVFEGITIPDPDWYNGGVGGTHFSSTEFTKGLDGFSSAFSQSSGSSGSSGGGSAGGGGGGGGGGSW